MTWLCFYSFGCSKFYVLVYLTVTAESFFISCICPWSFVPQYSDYGQYVNITVELIACFLYFVAMTYVLANPFSSTSLVSVI